MAENPTAAGAQPGSATDALEPDSRPDTEPKWPAWPKNGDVPELVLKAWELVCRGHDNWSLIARTLGFPEHVGRKQIKRDVIRYSKALAASDGSGVDPRAEAMTKYSRQSKELWKLYDQASGMVELETTATGEAIKVVHPRSQRIKLQVLRQLSEVTEREAALRGVVTRREARENEDKNPTPTTYNVTIVEQPGDRQAPAPSPAPQDDAAEEPGDSLADLEHLEEEPGGDD